MIYARKMMFNLKFFEERKRKNVKAWRQLYMNVYKAVKASTVIGDFTCLIMHNNAPFL